MRRKLSLINLIAEKNGNSARDGGLSMKVPAHSYDYGCELNIGYPVTGHKSDDLFTNAVADTQKLID